MTVAVRLVADRQTDQRLSHIQLTWPNGVRGTDGGSDADCALHVQQPVPQSG